MLQVQRLQPRFTASLLFYLVAVGATYAAVYQVPYALYDDYSALDASLNHDPSIIAATIVQGGRPTLGILYLFALGMMHYIGDIRAMRLVGVLGLALLAWFIQSSLSRTRLPRAMTYLLPIWIITMPPFQVWAAWCSLFAYAALLSGLAWFLAAAPNPDGKKWRYTRYVGAISLLTIAFTIYQPAAMFFLFFVALDLLPAQVPLGDRRWVRAGVIAAVGASLDYAAIRYLPQLIYGPGVSFPRSALTHDVAGKVSWFVANPLVDVLNFQLLSPSPLIALITGIAALTGLYAYFRGPWYQRLKYVCIAIALVIISYAPNLAVAENWSSYRTQAVMSSFLTFYVALGAVAAARRLPIGLRSGLARTAVLATIALAVVASTSVMMEYVLPQWLELRWLAEQVNTSQLASAKSIYLIPSSWRDSIAPVVRYDEFGLPSTFPRWSAPAMTRLLLREVAPSHSDIPVILAPESGAPEPPAGSLVIDCTKIRSLTGWW